MCCHVKLKKRSELRTTVPRLVLPFLTDKFVHFVGQQASTIHLHSGSFPSAKLLYKSAREKTGIVSDTNRDKHVVRVASHTCCNSLHVVVAGVGAQNGRTGLLSILDNSTFAVLEPENFLSHQSNLKRWHEVF